MIDLLRGSPFRSGPGTPAFRRGPALLAAMLGVVAIGLTDAAFATGPQASQAAGDSVRSAGRDVAVANESRPAGVTAVLPEGLPLEPPNRVPAQGRRFDGTPLQPVPLAAATEATYRSNYAEALKRWQAQPQEPESWIWLGRRRAYLGDYRGAIEIYDAALEHFPNEPRLLRHRGHRHITVRQLDTAIEDLSRAAELVAGTEDRIEPDGLPNARNLPRSTLHSNIHYHLGLAYFLRGEFERAAEVYFEALKVSTNPDMRTASAYWTYHTLRRLGREREAAAVLEPVRRHADIIENHDYHELLLLYRGDRDLHGVQQRMNDSSGIASPTLAFGLAHWLELQGQPDAAEERYRRIVITGNPAAFGTIAAEAELARGAGGR